MTSSIAFLQRNVSQLDEPVYARLHEISEAACSVIYWNDHGLARRAPDPETGLVSDLEDNSPCVYPRYWLDRRTESDKKVVDALLATEAERIVLADVPLRQRLRMCTLLRGAGRKLGFRSDKNCYSKPKSRGLSLCLERSICKLCFDFLVPVSPLTATYYGWPESRPSVMFPYATNERKWCVDARSRSSARSVKRQELGIPHNCFVFIAIMKFHDRENPHQVLQAFRRLRDARDDVFLIAVGDGPLMHDMRRYAAALPDLSIVFPGFVPFRALQDYVFAADVLLHCPRVGPWEVTPQDALMAGLGVICSDVVGSAQCLLPAQLRRFLVPVDDPEATATAMAELVALGPRAVEDLFLPARHAARRFSVDVSARGLVSFCRLEL